MATAAFSPFGHGEKGERSRFSSLFSFQHVPAFMVVVAAEVVVVVVVMVMVMIVIFAVYNVVVVVVAVV